MHLLLLLHHVGPLSGVMRYLRRIAIGRYASEGRAVVVVPGEEPVGGVTEGIRTREGIVTSGTAVAVRLHSLHLRLEAIRPQVMQGRGLAVRVQGVVLRCRRRSLSAEEVPKSVLHPLRVVVVDGVTLVRRRGDVRLAHVELAVRWSSRLLLLLLLMWQRRRLWRRVGPAWRWSPIGRGCRLSKGWSCRRHFCYNHLSTVSR